MKRDQRFEILKTIQDGMVATSYKARDRVLERTVLLKVLHPRKASDEGMVQRFRREAMLQARLKHPNIVTVYDFGTEEDMFIASEFIEGTTLDAILKQERRLTVERLAPLVLQVARALEYAHGRGVVHRDLKPANVMVDRHGEVKLADFGLAFARDLGQLTQEGSVVGTPSYMSPEQARGRKTDARTDLFSLGIVIYQALAGTNPFAADSFADAMSLVLNRVPEPLGTLVTGLPPEIDALVKRLLAKDPAGRPDSIADVIAVFSGRAAPGRRRSPFRIVFPAAALVFVVMVAVALSRRAATNPPATSELPDSTAARVTEPPLVVQDIRPGAQESKPASSPKTEVPPPVIGTCRARITVLPWAQVLVDGRPVGTTPLAERLVLSRGRHTIELKHPDFPAFLRSVVLDDSACDLRFDLNREFAFLDIRVSPWAALAIDGQPVDTTPLERPIALSLGEHILTLSHPELGEREERIRTDSARVYRFSYDLTRQ